MADRIFLAQRVVVAANASARASFCPPSSTRKWKLKSLTYVPNETSAIHATDYVDITPKKASTALAAVRSTNSGTGTALTQATPENITLTAVGTDLEITQAAPMHVLVDATPGAGVAVDLSIMAEFEELRI